MCNRGNEEVRAQCRMMTGSPIKTQPSQEEEKERHVQVKMVDPDIE